MGPPAGSAASTVLISNSANRSFPSQPSTLGALSGQVGTFQPQTLGPVTGQVAAIVRYRRPLVAGAVGVVSVVAAVGILIALLRHPAPVAAAGEGDAQLELAGSHGSTDRGPTPPADNRSAGKPAEAANPGGSGPQPPAPRPSVRSPAASGKQAKRRVAKRKPKAKAGKSPTGSKPGVSVVD